MCSKSISVEVEDELYDYIICISCIVFKKYKFIRV